jgi:hypothetical protein
MPAGLHVPLDKNSDPDFSADFLELAAFFATGDFVRISDVANEASIGTDEGSFDVDYEMRHGDEDIAHEIIQRIKSRVDALGPAYPFRLDAEDDILVYVPAGKSLGQAVYVLSLVLSNLQTSLLYESPLRPEDSEIRSLRQLFQYISTAALGAEIQGVAWSFGFPRPDGSGFLEKLKAIWSTFEDGVVHRKPGAPTHPKDDNVDVFAARIHRDRQGGFLLAAAQVATGQDWKKKSLLGHMQAFRHRWFADPPVTHFVPYMIVPFAIADTQLRDHVSFLGNVLHRLRVPVRVAEAVKLVETGVAKIETYDELQAVVDWVADYRDRVREAA